MSVDYFQEVSERKKRLDEAVEDRDFQQLGRVRTLPDFSNPLNLGLFTKGNDITKGSTSDAYNATKSYLSLPTEMQLAVDQYIGHATKPVSAMPPAFSPDDPTNIAKTIGSNVEQTRTIGEILKSGDNEATKSLQRAYELSLSETLSKDPLTAGMIENTEAYSAIRKMEYDINIGDSKVRRAANALTTGAFSTVFSSVQGVNAAVTDVTYAAVKGAGLLYDAANYFISDGTEDRKFIDDTLRSIQERARDIRRDTYVPLIQPQQNFFEDAFGAFGSMGAYVVAGMINPGLATGMLYSQSYHTMRQTMDIDDPIMGMVSAASFGLVMGRVNQIGLDSVMKGIRSPLQAGISNIGKSFIAEGTSEAAETWLTTAAYHFGGAFNGDQREKFSFWDTATESAYSGLIGGMAAAGVGTVQLPRYAKAQQQHKAYKRVHTELVDNLVGIVRTGDPVAIQIGRGMIDSFVSDNKLPSISYFRATDVNNLGKAYVDYFLEETLITREDFSSAVKHDSDLRANITDAIVADARGRISNGNLDPTVVSNEIIDKGAALYAGILEGNMDEAAAFAYQKNVFDLYKTEMNSAEFNSWWRNITEARNTIEEQKQAGKVDIDLFTRYKVEVAKGIFDIVKSKQASTLSDLARPDSTATTVGDIKTKLFDFSAMVAESNTQEVISTLDDAFMVKKLRQDLMGITNNADYVSGVMHNVKTSLMFLAKEKGLDPVTYANTIALDTVLSDPYRNQLIGDSASQFARIQKTQADQASRREARRAAAEAGVPYEPAPRAEIPPARALSKETVAELRKFRLADKYRDVLTNYIEAGGPTGDVTAVTNQVRSAVDTSNILAQQADQLEAMSESPMLGTVLEMFGLSPAETATGTLNTLVNEMRARSRQLLEFYKYPEVQQILPRISGIVQEVGGNQLNEAGESVGQWREGLSQRQVPVSLANRSLEYQDRAITFSQQYDRGEVGEFVFNKIRPIDVELLSPANNILRVTANSITGIAELSSFVTNTDPRWRVQRIGASKLQSGSDLNLVREHADSLIYTFTNDSIALMKDAIDFDIVSGRDLPKRQTLFTVINEHLSRTRPEGIVVDPSASWEYFNFFFDESVNAARASGEGYSPETGLNALAAYINSTQNTGKSLTQLTKDLTEYRGLDAYQTRLVPSLSELLFRSMRDGAFQTDALDALASVRNLADRAFQVRLTTGKYNARSFPHEWFHIFLKLAQVDAPATFSQFESIAGAPLFDTSGNATEAQELLASQYESYLITNENSSITKKDMFKQYSDFLAAVPNSDVFASTFKPSDDLRDLFDQVFTSKTNMDIAMEMNGLVESLVASMPDSNPAKPALEKLEQKAKLTGEQRAKKRVVGTYMKLADAEGASIRQAAYDEVNNRPDVVLWNDVKGLKMVDVNKLRNPETRRNSDAVLDWDLLNTYAEDSGYSTTDEMLNTLRIMDSPAKQRRMLYREKMNTRLDQLLDTLPDELGSMDLHSPDMGIYFDKMQEAIDSEIERSNKVQGNKLERAMVATAIKESARIAAGNIPFLKMMNYRPYVREFRRAVEEYKDFMAKGDTQTASTKLREVRMKHELIHHAVKARNLATSVDRKFGGRSTIRTRLNKIDSKLAEDVRTILGYYGVNNGFRNQQHSLNFTEEVSNGTADLIGSLSDGLGVAPWIVNMAKPEGLTSYRDLTYGQVKDLERAVSTLMRVGDKAIRYSKLSQFESLNEEKALVLENLKKIKTRPADFKGVGGIRGWAGSKMDALGSMSLLNEYILSKADGFSMIAGKGIGPLQTRWLSLVQAEGTAKQLYTAYGEKISPQLDIIGDVLTTNLDNVRREAGPLPSYLRDTHGYTEWTPELLQMIAFNTGNSGNLMIITDGLGMSKQQVEDIMNSISSKDRRFLPALQRVGDIISELYEPTQQAMLATRGYRSDPVDPMPFTYANGQTVKGFYFPIVTEGMSRGSHFLKNLFHESRPSATYERMVDPTTGEPVSARPAKLDRSVLANHLESVTRFIALGPITSETAKLFSDEDIKREFSQRFGTERWNEVMANLNHIANPDAMFAQGTDVGSKFVNGLRRRGILQALGLKLSSALKQPIDLASAMFNMGQMNRLNSDSVLDIPKAALNVAWKMGAKNWAGLVTKPGKDAEGNPTINGKIVNPTELDPIQFMFWKSDVVSAREDRILGNIEIASTRALGETGTLNIFGRKVGWDEVRDAWFAPLRLADRWSVAIAWNTQYNEAVAGRGTFEIKPGMTSSEIDQKAVLEADSIARTMSSNLISDMTQAQRSAFMSAFTPFLSAQVRRLGRGWNYVSAFKAGQIGASEMLLGLTNEIYAPVIGTVMIDTLLGMIFSPDEEKKKKIGMDGDQSTVYRDILLQPLIATLDTIPIANLGSSYLKGYDPSLLPIRGVTDMAERSKKAAKQFAKGNYTEAIQNAGGAAGFFLNVPIHGPTKTMLGVFEKLGYYKKSKNGSEWTLED